MSFWHWSIFKVTKWYFWKYLKLRYVSTWNNRIHIKLMYKPIIHTSNWGIEWHDTHQIDVLYKETLKATYKRELLKDLCFCACRKDLLPGVHRRHSWGKSHLRYPWGGLRFDPRSAHDATQVTPLFVPGFGLDVSQAQRIIAVGKLPLRQARDITMFPTILQWLTTC